MSHKNKIEAEKLSQTTDFLPSGAASCCASSGPRLRCTEKWSNGFYGTYKGHRVVIERDSNKSPWAFLVTAPDGGILADGYTKRPMSMREAIVHALTGACLWHNV